MKAIKTKLADCYILEPTVYSDNRGYFYESFNNQLFESITGLDVKFVQDNQSFSKIGTLRGLHFQKGEHAQAKLVRVLKGTVIDVAVDLRIKSATYGQYVVVELSAENKKQLFVPRGFAHGFVVLSAEAEFFYKCDNYYNKSSEGGILYNDSTLNIDWRIPESELIISEKDLELPLFLDL